MPMEAQKRSATDKFFGTIGDALTLDVVTLSGELDIKPTDGAKLELKDLAARVEDLLKSGINDGKISVIGYSKIEIDKDVKQFFRSGLNPETKNYLEAHNKAVETSLAQRGKFVQNIVDLLA